MRMMTVMALCVSLFASTACRNDGANPETGLSAMEALPVQLRDVVQVGGAVDRIAPRFSDDGQWLLVSGPKYAGLFRLNLEGQETPLDATRDGYGARVEEGKIVPASQLHRSLTRPDGQGLRYFQRDDAIYSLQDEVERRVLVAPGARYFRPQVSPTGDRLLVQELGSGMVVVDLPSFEILSLGRGSNPVWFPDGDRILYNVSTDDGVRITGSELYVRDLNQASAQQVTFTPERHELHGAVAPDGERIAFEAGLRIYVGRLN